MFGGRAQANTAGSISGTVTANKKFHLPNTVVYLERVPGKHGAPDEPAVMDQQKQKFLPHVLPVVRGTTVEFLNSDDMTHNVYSLDGDRYDLGTWSKGDSRTYTFAEEGVYTQLCKIHASMIAYVVVLQNPYFALTGEDGRFSINGVPAGEYRLAVWNERKRAKPIKVRVSAGKRTTVTISLGK